MARRNKTTKAGDFVVIGLGRYGAEVAEALEQLGHQVLAIDDDQATVERWAKQLTYVVQADATDSTALRQLGVADFDQVVIGIGSNVQASVLTVVALREADAKEIWARASSTKHAKILASEGADHVSYPEADQADRTARLISSKWLDYLDLDSDFTVAATRVPADVAGRTLAESGLRRRYGVTVVGVRHLGERFEYGNRDTVVPADAVLVVAGTIDQVSRFAATT